MPIIDNLNFFRDQRNCALAEIPTTFLDDGTAIELPWRWIVCPVCDGKGSHVNPSIDCNGLSAGDFADDPDFAESYFSGAYDQVCNRCGGRTTVPAVDEDRLTSEQREAWEADQRAERDSYAERLSEIRAGC